MGGLDFTVLRDAVMQKEKENVSIDCNTLLFEIQIPFTELILYHKRKEEKLYKKEYL